MAKWKKVIVSGSNAELNHLKLSEGKNVSDQASPLSFDTISGSTSTTPLVIDSSGNIFTGSAYAKAAGGNTVGGSGLSSSVAIVGAQTQTLVDGTLTFAGTSLIQTASSTVPLDLNQADIINVDDITSKGSGSFTSVSSSGGYTIHTSSFASISNQTLTVGSNTLTTHITASNIILEASGGITASVVPESLKPTFYLGIGANGEIEKIAESNVQGSGGGSGVTGLTTCSLNDNINIEVTQTEGSESEQELNVTGIAYIAGNGGNIIYLHGTGASFLNGGVHQAPSGSLIRLKGYSTGLGGFITVDFRSLGPVSISGTIDGTGDNFQVIDGIAFNENNAIEVTTDTAVGGAITSLTLDPAGHLIRANIFSVIQDVSTGVVEICLDPNLSLNDITQSGDLMFSGSSTHPTHGDQTTHQIFPVG